MRCARAVALAALVGLGACEAPEAPPPQRTAPDPTLTRPPSQPEVAPLSEAAAETVAELKRVAGAGMLRGLARRADAEDGFVSNFGNERHLRHWDLLRRTGVDPNAKLVELLEEPHAVKSVGSETWFVWPDLAALDPADLIPEKLSFKDRARLTELVGEDGVEAIRAGAAYPGFRTAVSSDGRWLYFVHEPGD